jgi:hypothetical protein
MTTNPILHRHCEAAQRLKRSIFGIWPEKMDGFGLRPHHDATVLGLLTPTRVLQPNQGMTTPRGCSEL